MWAEVANIDSCQTTLSPKDGLEQAIWPKSRLLTNMEFTDHEHLSGKTVFRPTGLPPGCPSTGCAFVRHARTNFMLNSVP
jgi:hypothetical protein